MNPRINFIEYLNNFEAYSNQAFARKKAQDNNWKGSNIIVESRKKVSEAINSGNLGALGRVFNEFPLTYKLMTDEKLERTFHAMDPKKYDQWLQKVRSLIREGQFDSIPHPELPDDPSLNILEFKPETLSAEQKILGEMIHEAATIILDEEGDIRHEILVAIGLKEYFYQNKENRKLHDKMVFQVIYSFVSQIIIGAMREVVDNEMRGDMDLTNRLGRVMTQFSADCMYEQNRFHFVKMQAGAPKEGVVYVEIKEEGLLFRAHGHGGNVTDGMIPWNQFPSHFPKDISALNQRGECHSDVISKIFPYDLAAMTEAQPELGMVYVRALPEGLEYKVLNQDGKLNGATIDWAGLPDDFPRTVPELLEAKAKFFPRILGVTSGLQHTGVPLKEFKITRLFKEQVLDARFEKSVYSEKAVANFLIHMSPEKVRKIVIADLKAIPKVLFDYSPHDSEQYITFMTKFVEARMKFWVDIMKYYQEHGELIALKILFDILPETIISRWRNTPNALEMNRSVDRQGLEVLQNVLQQEYKDSKAGGEIKEEKEGKEEKQLQREPDAESEEEVVLLSDEHERANFERWFNARGNIVVLNEILDKETLLGDTPSLRRQVVTTQLEDTRFNPALIQMPFLQLMNVMFEQSSAPDEFVNLLSVYFPKLAIQYTHETPDPLRTAVDNQFWRNAIKYLLEQKKNNVPLAPDLEARLQSYKPNIVTDFFKMLSDEKLDSTQRLNHINQTVARKTRFGDLMMTPNKSYFFDVLAKKDPEVYELYLRQLEHEDDFSIGLKLQDWKLIVEGLLAKEQMPTLSKEDYEVLFSHRKEITQQLIEYFKKEFPWEEQQISHLSKVIEGQNALGKLLADKPTGWFSWFSSNPRDEKGRVVTPFIADLIFQRTTLKAMLETRVEADRENKNNPPAQPQ